MSNGPDPALVNDWFTWWGVLFVAAVVAVAWVTAYILTPARQSEPAAVPVPVSPCALHGHHYCAQPIVWRCVHCADERKAEGVYDQNHAA